MYEKETKPLAQHLEPTTRHGRREMDSPKYVNRKEAPYFYEFLLTANGNNRNSITTYVNDACTRSQRYAEATT